MSVQTCESIKRGSATPATHDHGSSKLAGKSRPALSERPADQTNSLLDQCGTKPTSSLFISPTAASRPKLIETFMQALLELAAYFKANQCALFLLEHGAAAIVSSNGKRATPLAIAFKTKNIELIDGIFQHTEKTGFQKAFDKIMENSSYRNTIEQALASPVLYGINNIFSSALKKAVNEGNTVLISRFLTLPRLSDKALLENLDEFTKNKLLFLSLSENKPAISRCLIEAGASLSQRNEQCHTPLWHAIATGQQEIACLLIDNSIQKHEKTMAIDWETLSHAIDYQQDLVINYILEKAKIEGEFSDKIKNVLKNKYGQIVKILKKTMGEENSAIASALIYSCLGDKFKKIEMQREWQFLLSRVAKNEKSDIIYTLFESFLLPVNNPPGVLSVDKKKTSPLMYAINNGHIEAARLLINAGVDLSHEDDFGKTALLVAIKKRNPEIAELLIEKSNPIKLSTANRKYALYVLTKAIQNSLDITKKLLERLPQDLPADEPTNTPWVHPLERRPKKDPVTVSDFVAEALKAGKPSLRDVFVLFQFVLEQSGKGNERNETIALELARYIRENYKQFSDDPTSDLDEELDAQNDPEFARYLKAVDNFVARRESAASLVSTLGRVLSSAGGNLTS